MNPKGVFIMKAISNPYNYNLNEFKTIIINEKGEIIAGFVDDNKRLFPGTKIRFPIKGTEVLEVLENKRLVIVRELEKK